VEPLALALIAAFVLLYGLVSGRLERTPITGPIVFVAVGVLLWGVGVLGDGEGLFDRTLFDAVATITLLLVLFVDASRIRLGPLRREGSLPGRLLGVGLPLTVVLGTVAGVWLLGLPLWQAAILATILAPTDAALAQAVIDDERTPGRVRQALNVESGLNDGIGLPILLLFVSLAGADEGARSAVSWTLFVVQQLLGGALVGVALGWLSGWAVLRAVRGGWMSGSFQRLSVLAISFAAFYGAELAGGNGFVAVFAAGLAFGGVAHEVCAPLLRFAEAEGALLVLLTFLLFGALMVPQLGALGWGVVLYALLSLTLVRMLPVALSLIGKRLRPVTSLYLGWFGPRGIASILYLLLVVEERMVAGPLFDAAVLTVLISVALHGLSARPLSGAYARALEGADDGDAMMEMVEVEANPSRRAG
jgi:NhaP-type Na+/H+ or K+/H+ antiporter